MSQELFAGLAPVFSDLTPDATRPHALAWCGTHVTEDGEPAVVRVALHDDLLSFRTVLPELGLSEVDWARRIAALPDGARLGREFPSRGDGGSPLELRLALYLPIGSSASLEKFVTRTAHRFASAIDGCQAEIPDARTADVDTADAPAGFGEARAEIEARATVARGTILESTEDRSVVDLGDPETGVVVHITPTASGAVRFRASVTVPFDPELSDEDRTIGLLALGRLVVHANGATHTARVTLTDDDPGAVEIGCEVHLPLDAPSTSIDRAFGAVRAVAARITHPALALGDRRVARSYAVSLTGAA